ncbi:DUF4326 domain-containing protein [Nonomuraea sp. MG754425]|uniref:DUF4326 domain-containing protein n=1 Tax=Nonomuraea sp. MG754425 TaxID=2570319 RepID=UPI001F39AC14|nr:DUF4326 domain-containing protein [Nonomuraea sp. MG754425]MCF6467317.1 DUF4326 domain-containing protein [Nonomuraea sp. MG754425]
MGRRVKVAGDLFHGQVPAGAVYIGRAAPGLPRSPFANPFPVKVYGRKNSEIMYRQYLCDNPDLIDRAIQEIGDADVACWCKPTDWCHGDVLLPAMAARR